MNPSTPVANAPIVILNNTETKAAMEEKVGSYFAANGISVWRTKIGRDVVFRTGQLRCKRPWCLPFDGPSLLGRF